MIALVWNLTQVHWRAQRTPTNSTCRSRKRKPPPLPGPPPLVNPAPHPPHPSPRTPYRATISATLRGQCRVTARISRGYRRRIWRSWCNLRDWRWLGVVAALSPQQGQTNIRKRKKNTSNYKHCRDTLPWISQVGPWKAFETFCIKCIWLERCFESRR